MKADLLETIKAIAESIAEQVKLDLVDLNLNRRGMALIIDVIADHPEGGITIDECTELNRKLSDELEKQDLIKDDYIVEVSSPGLDRPLTNEKDFKRAAKREIRFHLKEKIDGKIEHQGIVQDITSDGVMVKTKKEVIKILYGQINKAIQII